MPIITPITPAPFTPTYTPNDAITMTQNMVHGIPVNNIKAYACDMANSMMWTFFPWGWSIKSLTPITLADGVQDYNPTNTDILRPLKMRIVRTDTTPNEFRELNMLANLGVELTRKGGLETNTSLGWFPSANFFRFMYAASIGGTQVLQLQGEYQFQPTKIVLANMGNVLPFPDYYFNVYTEGVLFWIYKLSDDPRAGGIQYSKNGNMIRQYSGQMGMFMDALLQMARTEDLSAGDEFAWPEQPLGVGRSYWPGMYGL